MSSQKDKPFIILCVLLALCLTCCSYPSPEPHPEPPEEDASPETAVCDADSLFAFLEGYLSPDTETGLTEARYLNHREFDMTVTYDVLRLYTEMPRFAARETDGLPAGTVVRKRKDGIYRRTVSTCYGCFSDLPFFFKETQTEERYRDADALTGYSVLTTDTDRFYTYGTVEKSTREETLKQYPFASVSDYAASAENLMTEAASDFRQYLLTFPFLLGEKDVTVEGEVTAVDGKILFSLFAESPMAKAETRGEIDLATYDLTATVKAWYSHPEVAVREAAYTVLLRSRDLSPIAFDTERQFTLSPDAGT
ncbi:MAG: hypothetical protein MJ078_04775 [Clostridia bacterium]|nr:hypothetical protein [Clostridia bacterium]